MFDKEVLNLHDRQHDVGGMLDVQEPELLEQVNMATGVYEAVAAMRVHEALEAAAKSGRMRQAGGLSARGAELAATDAIRLLDKAGDLYFQVVCISVLPECRHYMIPGKECTHIQKEAVGNSPYRS